MLWRESSPRQSAELLQCTQAVCCEQTGSGIICGKLSLEAPILDIFCREKVSYRTEQRRQSQLWAKPYDVQRRGQILEQADILVRLVSALLAETSEEWETGKTYLNMESKT